MPTDLPPMTKPVTTLTLINYAFTHRLPVGVRMKNSNINYGGTFVAKASDGFARLEADDGETFFVMVVDISIISMRLPPR